METEAAAQRSAFLNALKTHHYTSTRVARLCGQFLSLRRSQGQ
jgi:hypothetical protein